MKLGALPVALAFSLALTACAPAALGSLRPSLSLNAQAQEAQGELVLEFTGLPYQLQSLADLASLRVTLKRAGSQDLVRTLDAAALQAGQGRVSFEALSVGPISVEVEGLDAQGQLLGFARADAAVAAGESVRVPLRLSVGGPATQGGLGVDLVVNDDPASNVVRPLRLVAATGLPSTYINNPATEVARLRDLAFDARSHQLWAALGDGGVRRFLPDLASSQAMPAIRSYSLAAMPTGGVLTCEDHRPIVLNGSQLQTLPTITTQRIFPDGVGTQVVHQQQNGSFSLVMGATREGQAVYFLGGSSSFVGPGVPLSNGATTHPLWEAPTPYLTLPSTSTNGLGHGNHDLLGMEAGALPGEVLVHDPSKGLRITENGVGVLLVQGNAGPTPPVGLSLTQCVALAESQSQTGSLNGPIVALTPDHRGGHWVVQTLSSPLGQFAIVWRRSPDGRLTRVWGPHLSPTELAVLASAPRSMNPPADGSFHTSPTATTLSVVQDPNASTWAMRIDPLQGTATSEPGRLAMSNSAGLFILEEQAASTP